MSAGRRTAINKTTPKPVFIQPPGDRISDQFSWLPTNRSSNLSENDDLRSKTAQKRTAPLERHDEKTAKDNIRGDLMKVLFTVSGKRLFLADKERMIIGIDNESAYEYYDMKGNLVPAEDGFDYPDALNDTDDDPWESSWIKNEGIEEELIPESIKEIEWEIDDAFGLFGFKNRAGDFVIEPQFAYAHEFTCGLAAVNLNRTWYRTKEGQRFYENHYGFINERGETVIPFAYDEAKPFNKYGVAVVADRKHIYLIDTEGKVVPGTEDMLFSEFYEYDNRFLEFQC